MTPALRALAAFLAACHDHEALEADWLHGLVTAAAGWLDGGRGSVALIHDGVEIRDVVASPGLELPTLRRALAATPAAAWRERPLLRAGGLAGVNGGGVALLTPSLPAATDAELLAVLAHHLTLAHDVRRRLAAPIPSVLTAREAQIVALAADGRDNKTIAYDLGVSVSTVRVLVARAAGKLAVKGRRGLLAKLARQ